MSVEAGEIITDDLLNSLPAPLDVLSTGSVTNSTAETTIGTFPNGIPAGDATVNKAYEFVITGTTDSTGTPTLRIRLYVGSVSNANRIFDSGLLTTSLAGTALAWWIRTWIVITAAGTSGTFGGGGVFAINTAGAGNLGSSSFAGDNINTTIGNDIIITAQWGTASTSNTARTLGGTMGRL